MNPPRSSGDPRADLEDVRYMLSHDLRAPVRHIRALLDALLEDCAATLDDTARGYLQRATGAAEGLDGLLLAVLDFARLGLRDLRVASVGVTQAADEAVRHLEGQIAASGARISREGLAVRLAADRHVLVAVLEHLLVNALKFVAPGEAPQITLRAREAGARVRVSVLDRGIGIAPEHLERVFGMGARLHGEERYPGYGIGLTYVRRAVERMQGSVGVESAPGKGSEFWIELPAKVEQ
jgi:signal transduction histidine kinase